MPPADLGIIHAGAVVVPVKTGAVVELFFLLLLAIVFKLVVQSAHGFGRYTCHSESERIIISVPFAYATDFAGTRFEGPSKNC